MTELWAIFYFSPLMMFLFVSATNEPNQFDRKVWKKIPKSLQYLKYEKIEPTIRINLHRNTPEMNLLHVDQLQQHLFFDSFNTSRQKLLNSHDNNQLVSLVPSLFDTSSTHEKQHRPNETKTQITDEETREPASQLEVEMTKPTRTEIGRKQQHQVDRTKETNTKRNAAEFDSITTRRTQASQVRSQHQMPTRKESKHYVKRETTGKN